jgi:diaminohydroxyphosphoribosylaminopyrimidine deaminase/5-amino-6-(5-phosphoribosylamino)uracil reductase
MYVTLEPCCHRNKKTPPCTDALIPSGISRVVVAMEDPDVNVRGRGIAALRAAGIEVTTGVCEAAARRLLGPYITLRTEHRPWVIAKWAQTADGYLALPAGQGRWISSEASRRHAHAVRALCQGVLVGIGTALADDPQLTNRSGAGKQPARIVLDSQLRLPLSGQLVQTVRQSPLLVAVSPEGLAANAAKAHALAEAGAEVLAVPARSTGHLDLRQLLAELGRRQWTRLLVEGGREVLRDVLEQGLADELLVYVSPTEVGAVREDLPRLDVTEVAPFAAQINSDCPYLKAETNRDRPYLTGEDAESSLGGDRVLSWRRKV